MRLENIEAKIYGKTARTFRRVSVAKSVTFVLRKDVNEAATDFKGFLYYYNDEDTKIFERICYNDITDVKLIYTDETSKEYEVDWKEAENDYCVNRLQTSIITEDGNLLVSIHRD